MANRDDETEAIPPYEGDEVLFFFVAWVLIALLVLWGATLLWHTVTPAQARWTPAVARQFAQFSPQDLDWLRSQHSPATNINCCSEADGSLAEQDIRAGHYWARFHYNTATYDPERGQWMPGEDQTSEWLEVPDEVVIHDPNRHGAPVVWWYLQDGDVKIRCFAPGLLV